MIREKWCRVSLVKLGKQFVDSAIVVLLAAVTSAFVGELHEVFPGVDRNN
jgi:hypothetical protein